MPGFSIVRTETGEILRSGAASTSMVQMNCPEGCTAVEGRYNDATQSYDFENQSPIDRPKLFEATEFAISADGEDSVSLELPVGTKALINWQEHVIEDGLLEISSPVPATIDIIIWPPFPHQQQKLKVVAQ